MMTATPLYLASSSPRRHEILQALGLTFAAAGVDVDERCHEGEAPADMVVRLAAEKARAARVSRTCVVLAADTAVVLDGRVFGKPGDESEAIDMLMHLSGREHEVMTGVALLAGPELRTALSISEVRFREIRPDEARAYWHSGEPRDKAGAYAIQGLGGAFVASLAGSYSGVMGLPVFETAELLRWAGIDILTARLSGGQRR